MSVDISDPPCLIYKIECEGGRFVIYHASEIRNPCDYVPGKWYFRPYPSPMGFEAGEPFDTAEEAERAARGGANAVASTGHGHADAAGEAGWTHAPKC